MDGGTTVVPNVNPPVAVLVNAAEVVLLLVLVKLVALGGAGAAPTTPNVIPPTVTGAVAVDGMTIVGGAAEKINGVGIVLVVVVIVAVALVVLTMVGPVLVLFGSVVVVVESDRGASQEAQLVC